MQLCYDTINELECAVLNLRLNEANNRHYNRSYFNPKFRACRPNLSDTDQIFLVLISKMLCPQSCVECIINFILTYLSGYTDQSLFAYGKHREKKLCKQGDEEKR